MQISIQRDHGRLDVLNEWLRRGCPKSFRKNYEGRAYEIEAGKLVIIPNGCKFCHRIEPGCDSRNLILCSWCFQRVANSTQDQIKAVYELAVAKGYAEKAKVLKKFILEGDTENGGEQINVKREGRRLSKHFDRERSLETYRLQKIPVSQGAEQEAAAIPES